MLLLIQKPFSGSKSLSNSNWLRIFRHACVSVCLDLICIVGLILCGPFRYTLLFEHSDIVIIALLSTIFVRSYSTPRMRGSFLFIFGVICIIFFDHDVYDKENYHPEGSHKSLLIHRIFELFLYFGLSDHKVGAVILVLATCLETGFTSIARSLETTVGGAKRLHALSTAFTTPIFFVLLIGSFLFELVSQPQKIQTIDGMSEQSIMHPLYTAVIISFIAFTSVGDYYITQLVVKKLGPHLSSRLSSAAFIVSAFGFSLYANRYLSVETSETSHHTTDISRTNLNLPPHFLSTGVIFGMIALLYASNLLSYPLNSSSGKIFSRQFIGYSESALPLYTSQSVLTLSHVEDTGGSLSSLWNHASTILKSVFADGASFRIFGFLCLNLTFTFVELIYGVWTNSLGLISDGFHMLFDCAALIMGLYAAVVGRWQPNRVFSFGYHRAEILSGFINSLALIVIAASICIKSVFRIYTTPQILTDRLMAVSIVGLLVNLIGVLVLGHAHSHGGGHHGHSHSDSGTVHGHSHSNTNSHIPDSSGHHHAADVPNHSHQCHRHKSGTSDDCSSRSNLKGVYLHVLADTLGSVGVIVSSFFVTNYGWNIADPICSLFIAAAIACSAMPLLQETVVLLALCAPSDNSPARPDSVIQKVLGLDCVMEVSNPFIWMHSADSICCSLRVRPVEKFNEQFVLMRIKEALKSVNFNNLTVQIEKYSFIQHAEALGLRLDTFSKFQKPENIVPLFHNHSVSANNKQEYLSTVKPNKAWSAISF